MRPFFRKILPLGLIVLSVVVVVAMVVIARGNRPERKDTARQAMIIDAIAARKTSLNFSVYSQGPVKPRTETTLVAEVPGKIVSVSGNFIAGGFFQPGEILLNIDPSDYETALLRAQADLAARQAQLADWTARSEQALKDWNNLGRKGEPSDLTLHKPQLAEAEASVQAGEAGLQEAHRNLQRTQIKVPYAGLVRSKGVDVGQYVTPGTPLGVTFSIDTAEVRLPLSAGDLAFLNLPSATRLDEAHRVPVTLTEERAGSEREWRAEIVRTEGVVDEKSRMTYAVAEFVDPYGVLGINQGQELRMGTFVRAQIQGLRADDVVVLPRAVVRPDETVLVVGGDSTLQIRPVEVVRAEPINVYIRSGVAEGEWVITTAIDAPIPGTRLAIRDQTAAGIAGADQVPEGKAVENP